MGITRVRLTGPAWKVVKAVAVVVVAAGPVKVKFAGIPSWPTCRTVWLMVVLLVGKKAEKVLPAALKLTVIWLVAKRVIVTVAGLVVLTS